ncbi:MAG: hypothetical protein Q9220_000781 [cf. Caloplaca sp. 1 TL-2023]
MAHDSPTSAAQTYYDNPSTNAFYTTIWGGSDIHTGIYPTSETSITTASQLTVKHLASTVISSGIILNSATRVLDLGAGYGGAARWLAKEYGCSVVCLNLSSVQNTRNEELTKEAGLEEKIKVVEGKFENVPESVGGDFDVVWSQDSFLHSDDRAKIADEMARLLRKDGNGRIVFTDIMCTADAFDRQPKLMETMMGRLHLSSVGTVAGYKELFKERGFEDLGYWDGMKNFETHYRKAGEDMEKQKSEMKGMNAQEVERHLVGMRTWVKAAEEGCVDWGVFCFRRQKI